jgi:hypothetical protein
VVWWLQKKWVGLQRRCAQKAVATPVPCAEKQKREYVERSWERRERDGIEEEPWYAWEYKQTVLEAWEWEGDV